MVLGLKEYSWEMLEEEAIQEGRLTKPIFLKFEETQGPCAGSRSLRKIDLWRFEGHPQKILVGEMGVDIKNKYELDLSPPFCSVLLFGRKGQKPENIKVVKSPSEGRIANEVSSQVGYFNSHFNPVTVMWQNRETGELSTAIARLDPKKLDWISSYIGDVFGVFDLETNKEVYSHVVVGEGVEEILPFQENINQQCEFDWKAHKFDCEEEPHRDWNMIWRMQNASDQGRIRDNREHPNIVPHFTKVGYAKTRVPDDIWEIIMEFYHANKQTQTKEQWADSNTYTNHFEAPSYMIHLPEAGGLKPSIFNGLKPVLAEWSGVDELEATACYGIRIYTNNARLMGHCDRMNTHAISAIINVDQDVEEDWPLEIYNHDGVPTNITMKPGDLVLYESASCQHGRPYSMKGNQYVNMFVHYRPVDRALWVH